MAMSNYQPSALSTSYWETKGLSCFVRILHRNPTTILRSTQIFSNLDKNKMSIGWNNQNQKYFLSNTYCYPVYVFKNDNVFSKHSFASVVSNSNWYS